MGKAFPNPASLLEWFGDPKEPGALLGRLKEKPETTLFIVRKACGENKYMLWGAFIPDALDGEFAGSIHQATAEAERYMRDWVYSVSAIIKKKPDSVEETVERDFSRLMVRLVRIMGKDDPKDYLMSEVLAISCEMGLFGFNDLTCATTSKLVKLIKKHNGESLDLPGGKYSFQVVRAYRANEALCRVSVAIPF